MLTVIQYPNPILSKRCEFVQNVDRDIRDLAWEMLQVLKSQEAVGLAANQVGHDKRMFLVDIWWPHTGSNENCLYFINPLIVPLQRGTQLRDEGCLSFPGVTAKVKRAEAISVTALGLDGQPFSGRGQKVIRKSDPTPRVDIDIWGYELKTHITRCERALHRAEWEESLYGWLVNNWKIRELPVEGAKHIDWYTEATKHIRKVTK